MNMVLMNFIVWKVMLLLCTKFLINVNTQTCFESKLPRSGLLEQAKSSGLENRAADLRRSRRLRRQSLQVILRLYEGVIYVKFKQK
jgi:phage FluMu protein Com